MKRNIISAGANVGKAMNCFWTIFSDDYSQALGNMPQRPYCKKIDHRSRHKQKIGRYFFHTFQLHAESLVVALSHNPCAGGWSSIQPGDVFTQC